MLKSYRVVETASGRHGRPHAICLRVSRAVVVFVGLFAHAAYGAEQPPAEPGGPVAKKISLLWDQSLVRADVPVFGVAYGPDFKRCVLEFGEGSNPTEWHPVAAATYPRCTDPYAAGNVEWDPDSGAALRLCSGP